MNEWNDIFYSLADELYRLMQTLLILDPDPNTNDDNDDDDDDDDRVVDIAVMLPAID